jgi:hypothetical protein
MMDVRRSHTGVVVSPRTHTGNNFFQYGKNTGRGSSMEKNLSNSHHGDTPFPYTLWHVTPPHAIMDFGEEQIHIMALGRWTNHGMALGKPHIPIMTSRAQRNPTMAFHPFLVQA